MPIDIIKINSSQPYARRKYQNKAKQYYNNCFLMFQVKYLLKNVFLSISDILILIFESLLYSSNLIKAKLIKAKKVTVNVANFLVYFFI